MIPPDIVKAEGIFARGTNTTGRGDWLIMKWLKWLDNPFVAFMIMVALYVYGLNMLMGMFNFVSLN